MATDQKAGGSNPSRHATDEKSKGGFRFCFFCFFSYKKAAGSAFARMPEQEFDMLKIGCHLSCAKGFAAMSKDAHSIGANTFQFFTRNPRGGSAKAWQDADLSAFADFARAFGQSHFLAHAPYTLNACAARENVREFAYLTLEDDLKRLERLGGCLYNFHPGSHVGQGVDAGIEKIAQTLCAMPLADLHSTVLLETMAGKGSEIGGSFEQLRAIIDQVPANEKLGVCLDTCHAWDAGYDIAGDLDGVLEQFDRIIGLDRLKAVHLNDSMNPLGSRKDRHARLGEGQIGLDALVRVVNHPRLHALPFYLETPNDTLAGYGAEIALIQSRYDPPQPHCGSAHPKEHA